MPNYDSQSFNPPAPLAKVIIRNPETGAELSEIPMLLDTGADVTLLPKDVIELLGVTINSESSYELIGFDGNASTTNVVSVTLVFQGKVFRGQFLLIDQSWGILGRNILNSIPLLFDGPQLVWNIHK